MFKLLIIAASLFLSLSAAEKFTDTKYVFRYMEEVIKDQKNQKNIKCIVDDENKSICLIREEKAILKSENITLDLKTYRIHPKTGINYEEQKYSCGNKKEGRLCTAIIIAPSFYIEKDLFKEKDNYAIQLTNDSVYSSDDEYAFVINKNSKTGIAK